MFHNQFGERQVPLGGEIPLTKGRRDPGDRLGARLSSGARKNAARATAILSESQEARADYSNAADRGKSGGSDMISPILGSGLICVAMLILGLGLVIPVSVVVGDVCDLLAVGSGIFFVALLDNE